MKGIVLAGGYGTRMYPVTLGLGKQLLPIYDKPMIYYPIATLLMAKIREILVIVTPQELPLFQNLLGDGKQWGISIDYAIQLKPEGIAQAFIIAEQFIGNDSVCLVLGDNILYGQSLPMLLQDAANQKDGATVFTYIVRDPERYGVIVFDKENKPITIEEKPKLSKSKHAVTGIYFYDNEVVKIAKQLKPSVRNELEITDINRTYLDQGKLRAKTLGRGMAWLDTGTHESMLDASNFIYVLEMRQGLKICCPEELAWRNGYINDSELNRLAEPLLNSNYGQYLQSLLQT